MRKQLLTRVRNDSHNPDAERSRDLGGISGTASGVATPRPSGTDKRLPGILHNYFGQVGAKLFSDRQSDQALHSAIHDDGLVPAKSAVGGLPTAPASPMKEETGNGVRSDEPNNVGRAVFMESQALNAYPTPPTSSPRSTSSGNREEVEGSMVKPRVTEIFQANRPKLGRLLSGSPALQVHARRHTQSATSLPVTSITTDLSVHAAHISNPANPASSTGPSTPISDVPSVSASALSSLNSHLEVLKLTDGIAGSTEKATPPITPRTLSNDGNETAKHDSSPNGRSAQRVDSTSTITPNGARAGPPLTAVKGKLIVRILGGRGLRPSYDPYAVCVFEWVESIARGHLEDEAETETPSKGREDSLGALTIKRTGSDMGRSMAIPMKSRQSSNTSLSDQKEFKNAKEITDPQWDHEAVL